MKKLIIFMLLPLVLILGAGAGAFFFGLLPEGLLGGEKVVEEMKDEDTPSPSYQAQGETRAFYMLDEFVANLQTERREPVFLLLSIAVEIPNDDAAGIIQASEPRIRDSVVFYLSSLDPDDLAGYDGIQTLRKEI